MIGLYPITVMSKDIRDTPQWRIMDALPTDLEVKFEQRGHAMGLEYYLTGPSAMIELPFRLRSLPAADLERVIVAWESGVPLETPVRVYARISDACQYCGSTGVVTDGFTVMATGPCPYPNGFEVINVTLEVPSGFLVIGNDFRDEFPAPEDDYYVNLASEIKRCIEDYAQSKMLHFFVGNTCPGVYRTGEDEFVIANSRGPTEQEESSDEDWENKVEAELGGKVASVVTDLWWVSIVDRGEADMRGLGYRTGAWYENDPVPVTPGTYQLEYFGMRKGLDRDDYTTPTIWARLSRENL